MANERTPAEERALALAVKEFRQKSEFRVLLSNFQTSCEIGDHITECRAAVERAYADALVPPTVDAPPHPLMTEALRVQNDLALARLEKATRLGDALEWIERNHPDGIALVARALAETSPSKSEGR